MTSNRIQGVLGSISKLLECAICLDLLKNPVTTKCNHSFCRFCLTEFLKNKKSVPCPLCNEAVTKRSLQDQDRLSEIVTHVRGLITGYQQDTGEFFSPPRVNHDVNAFFPSTPETIFSQREQVPNKRQTTKRNVEKNNLSDQKEGRNITEENDDETSEVQDARDRRTLRRGNKKETITRNTTRRQRTRTGTRLATEKNEENSTRIGKENEELPSIEARTKEKSIDEIEKEEALLQYLDQGSCGVARSEDEDECPSHESAANIADEDHHKIQRSSGKRNEDKDSSKHHWSPGKDRIETEDDNECPQEVGHERMDLDDIHSVKEITVDGIHENAHPVCVLEKMRDEVLRSRVNPGCPSTKVKNCAKGKQQSTKYNEVLTIEVDHNVPKTKSILELTPEIEYEGEEYDLGDDLPLFQSQEVKMKDKSSKVKLNIYSGKKLESVGTRNQGKQKSKNLCEQNFDNESMMSFSESPVELTREFQSLGHVKTYSKTALQKNRKSNLVKQWVQKAQTATGNHSFSESDSQFSSEEVRFRERLKENKDSAFDNFGFIALEDSTQGSKNDTSDNIVPKRKKIFKTKVKEVSPEISSQDEGEQQNSDPYEFKSSGTAPTTQQKRGRKSKKSVIASKTFPVQKEVQKTSKDSQGVFEDVEELNKVNADVPKRTKSKKEKMHVVDVDAELPKSTKSKKGSLDEVDADIPKRMKSKKDKHVHFALKSPEQELTHLMEKIGSAEDHDFLFSTQEAKSSMAEPEEEEEEVLLVPEADIETMDDVSQDTAGSASEKSQSLSVVPPTPLLPVSTKKFQSPPKRSSRTTKQDNSSAVTSFHPIDKSEKTQSLSKQDNVSVVPTPLPSIEETETTQSLSMIPPTPLLPIEDLPKGPTSGKQMSKKADITSVPQTPCVETEDIHLTDSESCSQMPLPIPRRKKDCQDVKSPGASSGPAQISPTSIAHESAKNLPNEDEDECRNSDSSSSTEDLNITSDHTQFEEADLDIQPEEIRKQLSQISQDSVKRSSQENAKSNRHSQDHNLSKSNKKGPNNINASHAVPSVQPEHPPKDDDELTVVAGTVETVASEKDLQAGIPLPDENNEEECINSTIEASLDIIEDTVQSSGRSTRSNKIQIKPKAKALGRRQRVTRKHSRKAQINEDLIEVKDSDEEHMDKFAAPDTQNRHSAPLKPLGSEASTCPETQTNMSDKLTAISQTQTAVNVIRNSDSTVQVDSQASTQPTSMENLQDVQTLPPEDVMEDEDDPENAMGSVDNPHADALGTNDHQEVREQDEDTASNIPETITESVSLLEPLCEEQHEDEVQFLSGKSAEASTLESISILHDGEPVKEIRKGFDDEASVGDSCGPSQDLLRDDMNDRHCKEKSKDQTFGSPKNNKQNNYVKGKDRQKRKREDEAAEDSFETPTVSRDGSLPIVSSAPVTINLDDSEDEMLVVRRPKRKCFSLEGSPLKAKAKLARAKLSRKVKPSPRHLDLSNQETCRETELETMEVETIDVDLNEDKLEMEKVSETVTQEHQTDLQLVSTLPEESQMEQSMEDIFNKNPEDVAVVAPSNALDENSDDDVKIVPNQASTITPQRSSKLQKLSKYLDSDSDSDDSDNTGSVRKGVRAARGLASNKKKLGKSPMGTSSEVSPGLTGSVAKILKSAKRLVERDKPESQRKTLGRSPMGTASGSSPGITHSGRSKKVTKTSNLENIDNINVQLSESPKTITSSSKSSSQNSRRKLSLDDSEFVGPTPTPRRSTTDLKDKTRSKDADLTVVLLSSGSEMSGRSQKMKENSKGDSHTADCQVGISPTVKVIEEDEVQILPDDLDPQDSSSDEEFVLRDDDEVIRKAEMPTVNDIYCELPKSSPPPCASSPRQDVSSGSDVEPTKTSSRKQSRCPVISDSDDDDSDDNSIHSNQDEQMNCTSSSAFSSQSEMLTTQQQGRLEKDVESMREKIRHLEALKDAAGGTDSADGPRNEQVLDTEECSKETANTITPSNKTKSDDDGDEESSSDGELFLSPLSPSPPPPKSPTPETSKQDRKSQQVADAFEIINKFRSPNLTKSKEMLKKLCKDAEKKTKDGKVKKNGGQREVTPKTKGVNQSDLPLGNSPTLTPRQIKMEKSDSGRKVLSPLVFENKDKKQSKMIVMITSGLAREQMVSVQEFVSKPGNKFFPKFNKTVTHVILRKAPGQQDAICDRTLKFFLGVVAKCWVLSFDWVRDSLLAGKPVPEESYEMVGDTVSVENHFGPKRSRLTKKKLFSGFAFACIGVSNEMTKDDMRLLLELGGAQVAEDPWELGAVKADVPLIIRCLDFEERPNQSELESLNNFYKHFRLVTISREWVLDSISTYRIQPLKEEYIINTNKNVILPF